MYGKKPGGLYACRIPPGSVYYSVYLTASIETKNPNAILIGTKFGFLNYGGRYKTRIQALAYYIVLKSTKSSHFSENYELLLTYSYYALPVCVKL